MSNRLQKNINNIKGIALTQVCLSLFCLTDKAQSISISPTTCAANSVEIPGQEWAFGFTSGEAYAGNRANRVPVTNAIFSSTGNTSSKIGYESDKTPIAVDLIVIDNTEPSPAAITLEGTKIAITSLRHGNLVVAHIRAILEDAGYSSTSSNWLSYSNGERWINILVDSPPSPNPAPKIPSFLADTPFIIPNIPLKSISNLEDLPYFKTLPSDFKFPIQNFRGLDFRPNALLNYLNRPLSSDPKVPTAPLSPNNSLNSSASRSPYRIINMSLSILDCKIFNSYSKIRAQKGIEGISYTFREHLFNYKRNRGYSSQQVQKEIESVPINSPFFYTLNDLLKRNSDYPIAVAASGNYSLDWSTSPGSQPKVISVGARNWDWTQTGWSNASDIISIGKDFILPISQLKRFCRDGGTCVADDLNAIPDSYEFFSYSGTSFAAPSVSAFLAMHISSDNPCYKDAGPLGFKPVQEKYKKLEFKDDLIYQDCSENSNPPNEP